MSTRLGESSERREAHPSHVSTQREAAKEAGSALLLLARDRRNRGDGGRLGEAVLARPGCRARATSMAVSRKRFVTLGNFVI